MDWLHLWSWPTGVLQYHSGRLVSRVSKVDIQERAVCPQSKSILNMTVTEYEIERQVGEKSCLGQTVVLNKIVDSWSEPEYGGTCAEMNHCSDIY